MNQTFISLAPKVLQGAFVGDRQIQENVIVAQEVFYHLKRREGKGGLC